MQLGCGEVSVFLPMHIILTQNTTTTTSTTTTTITTTPIKNGVHKRQVLKMKDSNYCNKILQYIGIQHTSQYNTLNLFMCNMSRQGSNHLYDALTLFKTSANVVPKFSTSRTTIRWNIYFTAMLNQTLLLFMILICYFISLLQIMVYHRPSMLHTAAD